MWRRSIVTVAHCMGNGWCGADVRRSWRTLQPGNQDVYQRLCGLGKAKKVALVAVSGNCDDTQGDTQASYALVDEAVSTGLTVTTVAVPAIHGVALPGWRDAEQSCGQLDRPQDCSVIAPIVTPARLCRNYSGIQAEG